MKSKVRNLWDWRKLFKKQRKEYKQLQSHFVEYRCNAVKIITNLEDANSELQKRLAMRDAIINILAKDPNIRIQYLQESVTRDIALLGSSYFNHVIIGSSCKVQLEFPTSWKFPKELKWSKLEKF